MIAPNRRPPVMMVFAAVGGSLTGAVVRWIADHVLPAIPGSSLTQALLVSAGGGAVLGAALGFTLVKGAGIQPRFPLTVAISAAIGTFGAGVLLEVAPNAVDSEPLWIAALANVGATIVAAAAVAVLTRRWCVRAANGSR